MKNEKKFNLYLVFAIAAIGLYAAGCDKDRKESTREFPTGVEWIGVDISGWPVTAHLDAAQNGKDVVLSSDKRGIWPGKKTAEGTGCNANAWIIAQVNGRWYAANWEWLRVNQTFKRLNGNLGTYIKNEKIPANWHPAKGQYVGLMVSGLVRLGNRNVAERSNVVWINWK